MITRGENKKEREIIINNCLKESEYRGGELDEKKAVTYLYLKSKGVEKKEALKFCKKEKCVIDSTKEKIGPVGKNIIKAIYDKRSIFKGNVIDRKVDYSLSNTFTTNIN
jgi:hypothetical protein